LCIGSDAEKQVADLSVSESSLDGVITKAEIKEDCEQYELKPKADGDSDKLNTTLKSVTDVAPDCSQIKTEPVDVTNEDSVDIKSALSTETEKTVVKADDVSLECESKCTDCDDKNSGSIVSLSIPDAKQDNSAACKDIEKPADVIKETDLSGKQNCSSTEACVESCTQPGIYFDIVCGIYQYDNLKVCPEPKAKKYVQTWEIITQSIYNTWALIAL
jgi:hypothetical protein